VIGKVLPKTENLGLDNGTGFIDGLHAVARVCGLGKLPSTLPRASRTRPDGYEASASRLASELASQK
jgi:hypothetical protein